VSQFFTVHQVDILTTFALFHLRPGCGRARISPLIHIRTCPLFIWTVALRGLRGYNEP